jgi:hypothetical protein
MRQMGESFPLEEARLPARRKTLKRPRGYHEGNEKFCAICVVPDRQKSERKESAEELESFSF